MRHPLLLASAALCVASIALLVGVQVLGETRPPLPLFLVFTGVWAFGAVMLLVAPRFGAAGTTLYGLLMGVQVLLMHGGSALNVLIALVSLAAAGTAGAWLVLRWRHG